MLKKIKTACKGLCLAAVLVGAANLMPSTALAAELTPAEAAEITAGLSAEGGTVYPIGLPNTAYEKYFTGRSYLQPMTGGSGINVANVTFEPGCINHWHRHKGSCQVLVGAAGVGYYQIWGSEPVKMLPGDSVSIPEGVKHWHGAAPGSWFQHFAIMQDGAGTEWLEPVSQAEYAKLK